MAEILSTLSLNGDQGTPTNGGGAYTSIVTWEADQQQNLVTGGNTAVLECYTFTEEISSRFTILDWVVDATHNVTVRAAQGHANNGVVGAGYILDAVSVGSTTFGAMAVGLNQGTVISDISIFQAVSTIANGCISSNSSSEGARTLLKNLILRNLSTNTSSFCARWAAFGVFCENVLVTQSGGLGFTLNSNSSDDASFKNCNAFNCNIGFDIGVENIIDVTYENCLGYDNNTDFGSGPNWVGNTLTNCASGDATATGTLPQTGVTTADFEDYAGGNYVPATGGKLDGTGADLSLDFTNDIAGVTRTVPWTIGAFAIPSGVTVTYALSPDSGPLPAGVTIDPATGNLVGTPTEPGTFANVIVRGTIS